MNTNGVPTAHKALAPAVNMYMEEVTISARNSKTDTRAQQIGKVIATSTVQPAIVKAEVPVTQLAPVSELQLKYAALLNIVPNSFSNEALLEGMDEWYGTRYQYGGTTKRGVDCSAFTREMYKMAYGMELPRTAREQFGKVRKISTTDLKEGDLLFFNTTGGVSHVGIYLNNNKFVHSSTSRGVTISDLYETYYISRFIGAGRIEKGGEYMANNQGYSGSTVN